MNIFKNKAAKKRLENQQKAEIDIQEKLRQLKNKWVSESFVSGFLYCHNFLFEKHLKDFDSLTDTEKEQAKENLLKEIIDGNNKYLNQKKNQN